MISTPRDQGFVFDRDHSSSLSPIQQEDPPTQRVSVVAPRDGISCSVQTPPPSGERRLSSSAASLATGTAFPAVKGIAAPVKVGDRILGFELVEELGQGAFARVFLARQESLAGRLVALKVTLRPTREAEKLARLQHTHIVPVYSIHDAEPLQIICMPFLGRRTIADLIRAFRSDNLPGGVVQRKTSGTRAAGTTTVPYSGSTSKTAPSPKTFTPIPFSADETLPEPIGDPVAVLKLIGQLARGLEHAHARGILHLDLKPANVLLADTGEPMLLDFNLSFDVAQPERELVGGTVPYMSVEQLRDLRSRGKGQVDARSDLYSLGIMAFEMLTGTLPFQATFLADIAGLIEARRKGPPLIRAINPRVSPACEAIVRKLLEADPAERYQNANELCIDIERHLSHQALRFAREPSLRERFTKWRRRNPSLAGRLLAAGFLGLALALGGVAYSRAEAIAKTQAVLRVAALQQQLARLRLDLILPGDLVARKRGMEDATTMLDSYALLSDANWKQQKAVERLSERDRAVLEGTLGEVAALLSQAMWLETEGRADEQRRTAARSALKLNRIARDCFSVDATTELLEQQAAEWNEYLGEAPGQARSRAENREPDARDLFLSAASQIARGYYFTAIGSLEKAIELQPGHAAAHCCLAYCRQQLGEYDRAIDRYESARVLMPSDARPYYETGRIHAMRHQFQLAETKFSQAIALDDHYTAAYRARGIVRWQQKALPGAESDVTMALDQGGSPIQLHMIRSQVRSQRGDSEGAKADREAAKDLKPEEEGDFIVRGVMNLESDPPSALSDFEHAESVNPRSVAAIMNQVHVLADKLGENQEALARATRAVRLFPEYAPLKASRAITLARLGRRDEAQQEVANARKLSQDSEIVYRAACVFALTASSHPEDAREAINLLWEAVRKGYRNGAVLKTDKDLDAIRKMKEFQLIEQSMQ